MVFVNRCLIHLNVWWQKIITHNDLRKATGQEDVNLKLRKRKFECIGHKLRKEDRETPETTLQWNPRGSRKRGRPKNSWRRLVIKEAGICWNDLRFLATDRQVERTCRPPTLLIGTSVLIVVYVPFCVLCLTVLFVCKCILDYCHRISVHFQTILTDIFLCFFLICKANARV
jgi:hypothetical protein